MTQDMKEESILQMGFDKMIPRQVYDKPFTIDYPIKVNRKRAFNPTEGWGLIW
jgi:arginine decarboxylase-like protein